MPSIVTHARQERGIYGENLATEALASRGYAITERRYRTRYGEIDIVAWDGPTIVFVEVRFKSAGEFGTAADSVTLRKQRKVIRMAVEYLTMRGLYDRCPVRFDVVAIDEQPSGEPRITLYRDAFDVTRG